MVGATAQSKNHEGLTTSYRPAMVAGFAGWLLDAFDFFLMTFCLTAIAKDFHKSDVQIALVITMTLAFRPVGGFVFGLLADRYGRRIPLMVNLGLFAAAEVFTGLATSYFMLLLVRAVFGIVMGGQWGVGSSLVMEQAPVNKRGILSGLLQEGYAAGNVLAALSFFFLYGRVGWRPLFFVGTLPALAVLLFIRFKVKESEVWKKAKPQTWGQQSREIVSHWRLFLYLLVFMTMMLFASHGTQDMYPTFLQRQWHFTPMRRSAITAIAGIGAIIGGIVGGHFSDKWGRRRVIVSAFVCGILLVPLWSFAPTQLLLVVGAFFMQFMVQAAWGVIPAHLAELSPNSVRAFLPGFAYQTAGVLASSVVYIEASYAQHTSYGMAMALTAVSVFVLASLFTFFGRERRGFDFGADDQ
jgi:MFS transporter, SHS family, lactate transporter